MSRRFDFIRACSKGTAFTPVVVTPPVVNAALPAYIPAITPLSPPLSDYGVTVTTNAQMTTALTTATAGQRIWVADGTYNGFSFNRNIGTNPIRITAINPGAVTFTGGTGTAINPSGGNGIAFDGVNITMTDIPNTGGNFIQVISLGSMSNFWLMNSTVVGSAPNGTDPLYGMFGNGIQCSLGASNINVFNCTFRNLRRGLNLVDCDGLQVFGVRGEFLSEDLFHTTGLWNAKVYYAYHINPRVANSEHADAFQFETAAGSRGPKNVTLYRVASFCEPEIAATRLSNGFTISQARTQLILLQDENGSRPGDNIMIAGCLGYGTELTGINVYGLHTNLTIRDNELYHIDASDRATENKTSLAIGSGANTPPASGSITGNIANNFDTANAVAMTGQHLSGIQANTTVLPADRATRVTAYLAEAAAIKTALGL